MKKKSHVLGFLCLFALFSFVPLQANTPNFPNSKVKTLRTEIISLIKKPDTGLIKKEEESVRLSFLVNSKKELVVISADTPNTSLERYVKSTLNYQQIETEYVQKNKIYYIKLTFKK